MFFDCCHLDYPRTRIIIVRWPRKLMLRIEHRSTRPPACLPASLSLQSVSNHTRVAAAKEDKHGRVSSLPKDSTAPCSCERRARARPQERDQSMNLRPLARPPSPLPLFLPSCCAALFIHTRIRSTPGGGRGCREGGEGRSRLLARGRRADPVLRARQPSLSLSPSLSLLPSSKQHLPSLLPCLSARPNVRLFLSLPFSLSYVRKSKKAT